MDSEEFERLNQEEQERVFHQIPFRERGELLLHSHDPNQLVRSLSQEELYLITREMDLEERSEAIRYASLPQLFFISDIDCWKKDRVDSDGFIHWLETLQEADEERLLAWLIEMDYETIVSGLRLLIKVIKPEWEYPSDEMLGDHPFFTLDERYFILVQEENYDVVRRAIEVLYENHRRRYVAILEGMLGELEYELEEEAFQKRSKRLAERGFPDPESAHQIYRPLTKEEFEQFPRKNGVPVQSADEDASSKTPIPHYPALWSQERFFLDDVLLLFREDPQEIREALEEELAWLSNKVIACEGIDLASEERVRHGIERARRLVNIGLEGLSERDLNRAKQIMKEHWLELILRRGVTLLLELRTVAQRIAEHYWGGSRKAFLEFLAPPYESIFRGFFQPLPLCYDSEVKDQVNPLRDFKNIQDLERMRQALRQIEKIHEFLNQEFPSLFHRIHLEMTRGIQQASLFSILGTAFATFVLKGKTSSHPISEKETLHFLEKGFEAGKIRRMLKKEYKEKLFHTFFSEEEQELLRPLWALVFQGLEEELGNVDPEKDLDFRFVSSLEVLKEREGKSHPIKR